MSRRATSLAASPSPVTKAKLSDSSSSDETRHRDAQLADASSAPMVGEAAMDAEPTILAPALQPPRPGQQLHGSDPSFFYSTLPFTPAPFLPLDSPSSRAHESFLKSRSEKSADTENNNSGSAVNLSTLHRPSSKDILPKELSNSNALAVGRGETNEQYKQYSNADSNNTKGQRMVRFDAEVGSFEFS